MDTDYDAIVLGTGLKECIISGLLSVDGLKVKCWPDTYYGWMALLSTLSKTMFCRFYTLIGTTTTAATALL